MFGIAASFLVISGIAALTYQVTWVRLLGLSMGATSAAISTVIAAFFLGLAIGSFLADKVPRRTVNDLKPYLALEAVIGISGLVLLPILLHLDNLVALVPALGKLLALKFLISMLLLAVPTICMGATFPIMASILVRRQQEVGLRVSQLYGLNTAGAVLGALLSGFWFIPRWGLDGAIYIAATLNFLIVAAGWQLNRVFRLAPPDDTATSSLSEGATATSELVLDNAADRKRALVILFVTGFVSIAVEVGWTKYLSIFTGTTIYGFAAILTVFLTGIAAGSWAVRNRLDHIESPRWWMALGLVLLALSLILARGGLTWIPGLYGAINHLDFPPAVVHGAKYVVVFFVLFIPTFIFGALFPLNLKLYCGNLSGIKSRIGHAYALNTLASIAGAVLAGFWIIPTFGTNALLASMALITLASSLIYLPIFAASKRRTALISAIVATLVVHSMVPNISYERLIASVQYRYDVDAITGGDPNFLFLKEGKAGVISMVTYNGTSAKLQNNGLNESILDRKQPDKGLLIETLLGIVPYMLQPEPKTAFVVGLGGGITARALTRTHIESIKVVELEPAVVDAGRSLYKGEIPALRDPRLELEFNDARNTLLVEDTQYDIIAAQPSHPWLAGASNVFTQEFWQIVYSRLNERGIFGQWVNLFNMDAETLRAVFKAFYTVFPHGIGFANIDTGDYLLFGSKQPIVFDVERINNVLAQQTIRDALSFYNVDSFHDLLWYFAHSRADTIRAAGDATPNRDTNILTEVRLAALTTLPQGDLNPYRFLRNNFTMDLTGYFAENGTQQLYEFFKYLLTWTNEFLIDTAASQLEKSDELLGRSGKYLLLLHRYKIDDAFALYAAHEDWPADVHRAHALALVERNRNEEAFAAIEAINDPRAHDTAEAQLLALTQQWDKLEKRHPSTDAERIWVLLAESRVDIVTAGAELALLLDEHTKDLLLLQALIRYYDETGDQQKLLYWNKKLAKAVDDEVDHYVRIANKAIDEDHTETANELIDRIAALDQDNVNIRRLQRRIEEQQAKGGDKKIQAINLNTEQAPEIIALTPPGTAEKRSD